MSLYNSNFGRGKIYRSCQQHQSVSLHDLSTGRHLLSVSFITSPKSNLCAALTTQNTTESNCIISHAQNTTALQLNIFLSGIYRLLIRSKGPSAFPSANNCQGQPQTPESLSVITYSTCTVKESRCLIVIRPATDGHLCQVPNPTKLKAMICP